MRDLAYVVSLSPDTIKEYSRIYGAFQWFVTAFNLDRDGESTVEYFSAYLGTLVQAYKADKVQPALQYFADIEERNLVVPKRFGRVKRGLKKIWALADRKKLKRDGVSTIVCLQDLAIFVVSLGHAL